MIKLLNKQIEKSIRESRRILHSRRGQVAVILILIVAVALVFYAISLNLGRLSQIKTVTTIASDSATSQLASGMASYGEALSKTSLKGRKRICALTGVLAAIVAVIIAIIAVVTAQAELLYLAYAALALAVIALVVQLTVIQPGLTSSWNRIIQKTMSTRDQFAESAIQTALQRSVNDAKQVPDVTDADGDRVWEPITGVNEANPKDKVSRFAVYYGERLKRVKSGAAADITVFIAALKEFMFKGADGWGLYDPFPNPMPGCPSAECDPCCVPNSFTLYGEVNDNILPDGCDPDEANRQATCLGKTPYPNYPWVYDPYLENDQNNTNPADPNYFISFREQIGRDDEHQLFKKIMLNPNGPEVFDAPPPPPLPSLGQAWNFHLEDTTNFYAPPYYPPADPRPGIFPFFYKVADWKVNLNQTTDPFDLVNKPRQCHWCDPRDATLGSGVVGPCPAGQPPEIPQLSLDAANPPSGAVFDTSYCVDGIDANVAGNPPLAADKVTAPANVEETDKDAAGNPSPACAEDALTTGRGFWKRGGDRFCVVNPGTYPYFLQCPKNNYPPFGAGCVDAGSGQTVDCACGEGGTNPINFPDDVLDDIVYGLPQFFDWAQELLFKADQNINNLATDFENWYSDAALWIEPGTGAPPMGSNAIAGTDCFGTCNTEDGALITWRKELDMMIARLQGWRDASYVGTNCNQVWCVPPTQGAPNGYGLNECTDVTASEAATFDANANGTRGDLADVAACLDWNANHTVTFSDTTIATGNADRFMTCITACATSDPLTVEKCSDLPRSLVPGVDTQIPNQSDMARLQGCLSACNNSNCQAMSPIYFTGDPATTDFEATECPVWGPGNIWYDQIIAAMAGMCDPSPGGWLEGIQRSVPEARNQVVKFRARAQFLQGRLTEVNNMLDNVLIPARDKFVAFLDGPAADLIQTRISLGDQETGLPYQAIYGWKSDPPLSDPAAGQRWHLVKVDARLPGKCDNACNVDQTPTGDPPWPRIRTFTKNWGTRRCYELDNTDGVVKMRVTRFDENRGSSVLFPNGIPLWDFHYFHPDRPYDPNNPADPYSPQKLDVDCWPNMLHAYENGTGTSVYEGAFLLNKRITPAEATLTDPANTDCWDQAHAVLTRGVTSETCMKYYWHEGTHPGMGIKFIDCKDF